ncbi:MAG TPA: DUF4157 domain-containing protein [Gammaproteobacteria bacterium]
MPISASRASPSPLDALVAAFSARAAETLAGLERRLHDLDPHVVAAAAPMLARMIVESRDEAIAAGVEPVPEAIRAELADHVPPEILDLARWCANCGSELSLQKNAFRLGLAPAITLGHVIVFLNRDDALTDPALWAHELKHVMQFEEWGIDGFAGRYIDDYEAVEREAAEFRWEWVKRTGWLERRHAARAGG